VNKHQTGLEFEREVVDLYRLLGSRVIHNTIINGCQVDLLLESNIPGTAAAVRTIVECKAFARSVGIDVVNAFAVIFTNLRHNGKIDKGIIVSKSGFTAQAKAAADSAGIDLIEIDELRRLAEATSVSPEEVPEVEDTLPDRKYVFVLMPFDENFDNIFWFGIRGAVEEAGLYCKRAEEIYFTGNVLDTINDEIRKADVIVAEMTGRNPNVFYEVGIAHTVNKPTILLVQNSDDIPFDLRTQNHLVYNPNKIRDLQRKLSEILKVITC
jgi:hypothetical protein